MEILMSSTVCWFSLLVNVEADGVVYEVKNFDTRSGKSVNTPSTPVWLQNISQLFICKFNAYWCACFIAYRVRWHYKNCKILRRGDGAWFIAVQTERRKKTSVCTGVKTWQPVLSRIQVILSPTYFKLLVINRLKMPGDKCQVSPELFQGRRTALRAEKCQIPIMLSNFDPNIFIYNDRLATLLCWSVISFQRIVIKFRWFFQWNCFEILD